MMKTELVLPGGDFERAKIALNFGADAIYVGLNTYSLRKGEVKFSNSEIKKIISYAHKMNKKCYVTFNIFAHQKHLKGLEKDLKETSLLNPDAFIISDIGVMQMAKKIAPETPIHVSTQANVTNTEQVKYYKEIGAKRIVLARELTLNEIKEIRKSVPGIELEVFAHGSMCISYSGRCLLSSYMTSRHANLGNCAQPCRWNYRVDRVMSSELRDQKCKSKLSDKLKLETLNSKFFLEEEKRPGEYFQIEESEDGTNIMSSKDLCTIEYIGDMVKAGINGFKIEGRNKTEYYLASAALAYREALDLVKNDNYGERDKERLKENLQKTAHRDYTTGFLFNEAKKDEAYQGRSPIQNWEYVGAITKILNRKNKLYQVLIKNKIKKGMDVEVLTPNGIKKDRILEIIVDEKTMEDISPGKKNQTAVITLNEQYSGKNFIRAKS